MIRVSEENAQLRKQMDEMSNQITQLLSFIKEKHTTPTPITPAAIPQSVQPTTLPTIAPPPSNIVIPTPAPVELSPNSLQLVAKMVVQMMKQQQQINVEDVTLNTGDFPKVSDDINMSFNSEENTQDKT